MLVLFLGVVGGFWALGFPLCGILHGLPFPNLVAIPRAIGALAVSWLMLLFWDGVAWTLSAAKLAQWCAPLLGLGLLWVAAYPATISVIGNT